MDKSSKNVGIWIIAAIIIIGAIAAVVWAMNNQNTNQETATTQTDTQSNSNSSTAQTTSPNASTDPTAEIATISFTDNGFEPKTLSVKKGTTVTVVNNSSKSVQFSSDDHPAHRENTEMNLSELEPGESDSYVAQTVGTHGFHDHIDDSKTGSITVTE